MKPIKTGDLNPSKLVAAYNLQKPFTFKGITVTLPTKQTSGTSVQNSSYNSYATSRLYNFDYTVRKVSNKKVDIIFD